jgi:uncharacterized protein YdeI (BOF family)
MEEDFSKFAVKRLIKDIKADDEFVQVVGMVVKVLGKTKFDLADKSGKISCEPIPDDSPQLKEKMLVKVYGGVQYDDTGKIFIETTVIQDKTGLDLELYYKTLEMLNKVAYR